MEKRQNGGHWPAAVRYGVTDTPLGPVWVGVSERGVCDVALGASSEQGYRTRLAGWASDTRRDNQAVAASCAVGGALGRNPVPIIVPCHRVVTHARQLGGFTGGVAFKHTLLRLEGHAVTGEAAGARVVGDS